jgi:hypothetical protein
MKIDSASEHEFFLNKKSYLNHNNYEKAEKSTLPLFENLARMQTV